MGSGIACESTATVESSIVAGNGVPTSPLADVDSTGFYLNSFQSRGYNLIGGGNAVANFKSPGDQTGLFGAQLKLGPLQNNGGTTQTHALLPDSPAINAGDPTLSTDFSNSDQRGFGFVRVRAGRADIGAFELQTDTASPPAVEAIGDQYNLVYGPSDQVQQASVALRSDGVFLISAPGVLANDTNPISGSLTTSLAVAPLYGRVKVNADGSFFYLPNPGYIGPDVFFYTLSNGQSSRVGRVRLNVIDKRVPELRLDSPTNSATTKTILPVRGRVRDRESGVKSVTLLLRRFDGKFWDGQKWTATATQLETSVTGFNWIYNGSLPQPGNDSNTSLLDGSYDFTATATDNGGNPQRQTNRILAQNGTTSTPGVSSVRLSSATAAGGSIALNFTGALDATAAGNKANYRVSINGVITNTSNVVYSNNAVTLSGFNLKAGDKIELQIAALRDATGKTLAGGKIQLLAR